MSNSPRYTTSAKNSTAWDHTVGTGNATDEMKNGPISRVLYGNNLIQTVGTHTRPSDTGKAVKVIGKRT